MSDEGCTNCAAKPGCEDRKGPMLATVDDVLARLYPSRTWGEARDEHDSSLPSDELAGLADELASTLAAATLGQAAMVGNASLSLAASLRGAR